MLQFPFYSPLIEGTLRTRKVRHLWSKATAAADLTLSAPRGRIRVPHLSQVQIASSDGYQVTAVVDMSTVGKTSRELERRIETVTATFHAYQTKVERLNPAQSRITILFRPPQKPNYLNQTDQPIDLEQFPIQLDPTDPDPAVLMTKSILIGGESESGKSNLVWYILSQLNDANIPYRLHVIDPAGGVELADLEHSQLTRHYVDRAKDIPRLVDSFRESMDRRLRSMKQRGARRHFPTVAEPLEICLIDEVLLCKGQLKNGDAASPLGEVMTAGRKALHIVIGCSQLGEKLAIGQIRDLFPQRICLRTRTQDITDAVLGSQATQDGANCHRITQRGEGYVFTDQSATFEKFHAPLVEDTQRVAAGGSVPPPPTPPRTRKLRFW